MVINTNIAALNTYNRLSANQTNTNKSLAKLSSGLRINSAADDAAGLAISEKMKAQINGLNQASRNAQDGISLVQTAEGALNETHSILQRMNELATQAASGTLGDTDRSAITSEISQLNSEIDRISKSTNFNGQTLLSGSFGVQIGTSGLKVGSDGVTAIDISGANASTTFTITSSTAGAYTLTDSNGDSQNLTLADGSAGTLNFDKLGIKVTVNGTQTSAGLAATTAGTGTAGTIVTGATTAVSIQIGAENSTAQQLGLTINKVDTSASSLNTVSVDVSTVTNAETAMDTIQSAIDTVSTQRAQLGAYQNRLEHTINNLSTSSENMTAAQSRITDVDMASEMMNFTKNNILSQAATAMLAQANQQPQGVLQLLR